MTTHGRLFALLLVSVASTFLSPVPGEIQTTDRREALPDSTARALVQTSGLDWKINPPSRYRATDGRSILGIVSANHVHQVLVAARSSEWGQFGGASYALLDSTSRVLWQRAGSIVAAPIVSNLGQVALFQASSERLPGESTPVQLLILDVRGDTLSSQEWYNAYRPLQRGQLEEVGAFSPDGAHFVMSMNLADTANAFGLTNTSLWWVDLRSGRKHTSHLGTFQPGGDPTLECSTESAKLRGAWRAGFVLPPDTFDVGSYQVTWRNGKIRRADVQRVAY